MISQLSSGTPVNPTLSVVAPPGLQFFNDQKCVPIVYGNALIEGTIIDDMSTSLSGLVEDYIKYGSNYSSTLWQALCFGEIYLTCIIVDSNLLILNDGTFFTAANLNNGNPVSFQSKMPSIYEKLTSGSSYVLLPYLSPLHGIAHYYFDGINGNAVPWTDANNTTVKKVRYDVARILQTNIFNPGSGLTDDIPWANPEVDSFHTSAVWFEGHYSGDDAIMIPPNSSFMDNFAIGQKIVFLPPAAGQDVLDSNIVAGTVYYIVGINETPNGGNYYFSATLGGARIKYATYNMSQTKFYCSIPLFRTAGNNPGAVIFDILTNPFYGLALDATIDITPTTGALSGGTLNRDINVQSFWRVMNFFYTSTQKPYGVNCTFQEQTTAKDMIKKICEWTDCILTKDNNGKYYLTVNDPARLSTQGRMGGITLSSLQPVDSNGVPLLVTDDFIDFKPTFKTFDDTINEFRAKFTSYADSYTNLEVFSRIDANYAITNTWRSKEYDLANLIFPEIVATRIQEIAKRESFPLITIETVCPIGMITTLVNDIFHITHTEYGIDDYFKITKKCIGEVENGQVKISWVQCSELIFDLYGGAALNASPSVPTNTPPGQTIPGVTNINLTFPMGSNLSTVRSTAFTTDSTSIVSWGAGQENSGALVYTSDATFASGGDYTVIGHNQIKLNPTKWANTIQANILGLLNVDTQQGN